MSARSAPSSLNRHPDWMLAELAGSRGAGGHHYGVRHLLHTDRSHATKVDRAFTEKTGSAGGLGAKEMVPLIAWKTGAGQFR